MPAEITMPQLSDTMEEGTVTKWLKKEGDVVKAGEVIAEVETDKANMEMEAFEGGTLAVIVAPEGSKVKVGAAIAVLATGKETVESVKSAFGGKAKGNAKPQAAAANASSIPSAPTTTATATLEKAKITDAANFEIHDLSDNNHGATREKLPPHKKDESGDDNGNRIKISPLARRIALEAKIDIGVLKGSGPNGRIVQKDVLAAVDSGSAKKPEAPATAAPVEVKAQPGEKKLIPLTKMRQTIANRLQQAKQQIPHIYLSMDIEMDAINELREKVNKQLESQKIRVSIADFVAKAVASALTKNPAVNAHFDAKNEQIIQYSDVHIGNAVALPDGLIVPVLRNVQSMGLKEIRQKSADLFDRAKQQKLKRDELSGATFTITNLGIWGVKEFSAIVNPPEVAILAVSAAEQRAVVRNGQIVPRTIMTVTLSTDHRAVDGATAADFLKTLKSLLEEPGMMLV